MNKLKAALASALVAVCAAPLSAQASFVLDTGVPSGSGLAANLDSSDYYAAEFTLGASETITSIESYVTAGADSPGDTFTIALYSADDFGQRTSTPVFAGQATYEADGWTGLTGLGLSGLAAGNYWAAVEVGSADSAFALGLPTPAAGGTAPALAYAFNSGPGYTTVGAPAIGMEVQVAPVPLPGALLLFASGLLGLGGAARRRVARVD